MRFVTAFIFLIGIALADKEKISLFGITLGQTDVGSLHLSGGGIEPPKASPYFGFYYVAGKPGGKVVGLWANKDYDSSEKLEAIYRKALKLYYEDFGVPSVIDSAETVWHKGDYVVKLRKKRQTELEITVGRATKWDPPKPSVLLKKVVLPERPGAFVFLGVKMYGPMPKRRKDFNPMENVPDPSTWFKKYTMLLKGKPVRRYQRMRAEGNLNDAQLKNAFAQHYRKLTRRFGLPKTLRLKEGCYLAKWSFPACFFELGSNGDYFYFDAEAVPAEMEKRQ